MNKQWSRRPVYQVENSYETRIRYLEEVVHLLSSRTNLTLPPVIFSAPQTASFRYSTDRGLVPLLSKTTARSLAVAQSSYRASSHGPTISSRRSGLLSTSEAHRSLAVGKSRSVSSSPQSTNPQPPPLDTCFLPREGQSPSLNDRSPSLTDPPPSHAINTATENTRQLASLGSVSLADLEAVHTQPSADFTPTEIHASSQITSTGTSMPSISIVDAISNACCHPSDLTSPEPPQLNNQSPQQPQNPCGSSLTSTSANFPINKIEHSHQIYISPPPSRPSTPPALAERPELLPPSAPSPIYSTRPLPVLPACSLAIDSTSKAYPEEFDVTEGGAITVMEYSDCSMDFQLAPDLSQAALKQYEDIDNYLKLANADETKMKKKKKKKKKKANPTSTRDNPVSDTNSTPDNPVLFYV
ncbi:hypothetical protein PSTT_07325 [Puccinia striiformis]|uniref:Uncharacterized protein n=1 Tax=Puccinia striiformis TaxID=27350 RepID=A0A2S4VGL7_9BASI|nr:hypothetical protein PSTT_07325 [Puccinia striiformis]